MKITIIVEGRTERVFIPCLRAYLKPILGERMPKLDSLPQDGRIPTGNKLKRLVENLLCGGNASDHVIALTDVYTGSRPPEFHDAADAKSKMRQWVGDEPRFHPHAAQYDFEAWLLPYWSKIQKLAGSNRKRPSGNPEQVNHGKPPAYHLKEIFEAGSCRDSYSKPRDAGRILRDNDLSTAISECLELKQFIDTIIDICVETTQVGSDPIF